MYNYCDVVPESGCFILKIDWMPHTIQLSNSLSGVICFVQTDVAAVDVHQK